MRRRDFIKRAALVAGAASVSFGHALREDLQAKLILELTRTVTATPPDFIGLGYEISSVACPGLLAARNEVYVQLCRTIGSTGVIRVGGNTADYASYSASAQPLSSPETGPGSVVNDAVLRDLGTFLESTGWRLVWGLNLGRGTIEAAVEEAKAVLAATRPNLFAFEIGNEPDLFPHREIHRKKGYGYGDFLLEYRRFRDALRKSIPGIPFAGPDVAIDTSWVSRFAQDEGRDVKLLTHHYYREGQNPTSTVEKLLHPDPKLDPMLAELRAASKSCGVPYRICETNSFSGGGKPGVSDRFASALWVLDFMYKLASAQCGGVNMETGVNQLGFISSYSPIGEDEHGRYYAAPEFYGMLAFARGSAGEIIESQLSAGKLNLAAYATLQRHKQLCITLINKESEFDGSITIERTLPFRTGSVLRLSAASLESSTGVSFGGAMVKSDGTWRAEAEEKIRASDGRVVLRLPAASAAVVTMQL
ncbi:MAG TPA: glycosyl hydrolase family 79 C-terminal domain-containing protein [Candidatus Sulfotelmatobacter sp.]|nr:glycosyl hydrolase family 79 C-terminal domain-containing protein [Candidatus Sulfotelmatobacter sp.]